MLICLGFVQWLCFLMPSFNERRFGITPKSGQVFYKYKALLFIANLCNPPENNSFTFRVLKLLARGNNLEKHSEINICFELLKDFKTRQKHYRLYLAMWDENGTSDISPGVTNVFCVNFIGIDLPQHLLRHK